MSFTDRGMTIEVPYCAVDEYQRLEEELKKLNKKGNDFARCEEIDRLRYSVSETLLGVLSKEMKKKHLIPTK